MYLAGVSEKELKTFCAGYGEFHQNIEKVESEMPMFKLFKRLTSKGNRTDFDDSCFICLTVYLELEVPTYMSEITTLLQTRFGDNDIRRSIGAGLKMLGLSFTSYSPW